MSDLRSRFKRDCLYLSQGLVPIENSGKEVTALDYQINPEDGAQVVETLKDEDIIQLADSIKNN